MSAVDVLGSQRGRALRVVAGAAMIGSGARVGGAQGALLGVAGAVPLAAGAMDLCVLGPLVGGPLSGAAFRAHRAGRTR